MTYCKMTMVRRLLHGHGAAGLQHRRAYRNPCYRTREASRVTVPIPVRQNSNMQRLMLVGATAPYRYILYMALK